MTACLTLVGTPIGNRGDLSVRAREAIVAADVLFCEDTRSPTRLLGAETPLPPRRSCFVGNEHVRTDELLEALAAGQRVVYVSEAGMPGWSDPGLRLVRAAADAGFPVDVIPGPTAAATAICHAGFEGEVLFLGFVPRSGEARSRALRRVHQAGAVAVIYESGPRTPALLADLAAMPQLAGRAAVVARELTKAHQEVRRGTLQELAAELSAPPRGEVTVVIDRTPDEQDEWARLQAHARATFDVLLNPDLKPRPRARELARLTGLDARELYDRLRTLGEER